MNLELAKQGVTRFAGRSLLTLKKYSPEILTGLGVIGVVATTVVGSRATLKLPDVVDEIDAKRKMVRQHAESDIEYAKHGYQKDMFGVYAQGTWEITKLYAPTAVVGIASITCILSAHGILRRRNAALGAALVATIESFEAYRERVKEKIGEEEERKIYLNELQIEVPDEDGKPMALTTLGETANPYGRWFDEGSTQFSREPGYNYAFLRAEQNWFNDLLKARGYVFLSEVYKRLGLTPTREAQIVGWYYLGGDAQDDAPGDDYVDFGILNPEDPGARDFVNGWNKVVYLNFNVQGPILDYFPKGKGS